MELPPILAKYSGKKALIVDQGSTQAGWVILAKGFLTSGTIKCKGIASFDRVLFLFKELQELIDLHEPEVIVFEGGTTFTHRSLNARIILCHLHFRMEELGYFNDLPTVQVFSASVRAEWLKLVSKKYAGKKYSKDLLRDTVEHVFKLKGNRSQDELDALAIAYVYALRYKKLLADVLPGGV